MANEALCKLFNNHQVTEYHAACPVGERPYDAKIFQHIVDGVVHSVFRVKQPGYTVLSFFKVIKRKRKWL